MDGFTVSNANRFIESGGARELKTTVLDTPATKGGVGADTQQSFADTLKTAISSVDQMQKSADVAMQKLATGKTDNIPEVMIAAEKADIALKLMVQVRNKIIDAYHEVMKMQV
jgi:flagellar hook-basal body complex protein FliE